MTIEEQVEDVLERYTFREKLTELGYSLAEEDFNQAFAAFKNLSHRVEGDIEL